MALKLQVILCSTRPGRVGSSVAKWFVEFAAKHEGFDTNLIDLADFNLRCRVSCGHLECSEISITSERLA